MRDLRLVEGGRFEKGDAVLVAGWPGIVVCASWNSHVFRGEISVLMHTGDHVLVEEDRLSPAPRIARGTSPSSRLGGQPGGT